MTRMLVDVDVPDRVTEVAIRFQPYEEKPYWAVLYIYGDSNFHIGERANSAEAAFFNAMETLPRFDYVEAYSAARLPTGAA